LNPERHEDEIMTPHTQLRGTLLGLAVGDAVGTTLEFRTRGSFEPITDMLGGGFFDLKPGQWTDDTAMALCLAESLIERGGFDLTDQMHRYLRWFDEGHNSCTGSCDDIGNTVRDALNRFRESSDPRSGSTDPRSAGNGSIMRLAPVPIFFHRDPPMAVRLAEESSRGTHGARECRDACRLLATLILRAFAGKSREAILAPAATDPPPSSKIAAIAAGEYLAKTEREIKGSGYVVESLEAALWCFARTDSFEAAILAAANLGDDADTTAAICGQIAGAHYGESGIPGHWLERLAWREKIGGLADRLIDGGR
jgi:ADP-ribosyl-[dinitrogen reductase] hydrolase